MNFEPEKIERYEFEIQLGDELVVPIQHADGSFVYRSDYDQLLALYREATSEEALLRYYEGA